ncbi:hypothetical protein ACFVJW_26555 [Streptomyces libani]|uniref:hypothetical protein n=1 Tax=Streptomyces nigrescens TaxID=1920 RepID=UPI003641C56A
MRENDKAIFTLLDTQRDWRARSVERMEFSSARWVERTRSYHVMPLRDTLKKYMQGRILKPTSAWVRLPVGTLPKDLLLGFELTVAGAPTYRVLRSDSGGMQARYLMNLASAAGLPTTTPATFSTVSWPKISLEDLLDEIFTFEGSSWRKACGAQCGPHNPLLQYLSDGIFGTDKRGRKYLTAQVLEYWKSLTFDPMKQILGPRIEHEYNERETLATENPLLVLPRLKELGILGSFPHKSVSMLTCWRELNNLLGMAAQQSINPHATQSEREAAARLISSYGDYGYHWVVFTDCFIKLDEPFTVTMRERRPIPFQDNAVRKSFHFWTMHRGVTQKVTFNDAASNQISLHATDSNVEFAHRSLKVLDRKKKPLRPQPRQEYKNDELYLIYSNEDSRKNRIHVKSVLRPTFPIRIIHRFILIAILVTGLALGLTLSTSLVGAVTAAHLALILTPTTFAASLLLVRESSPLSASLTKAMRITIALSLAGLWLSIVALYLNDDIYAPKPPSPRPTPTVIPVRDVHS